MAGVFNERSTNVSQAEALERQGCEVYRFDYREVANKMKKTGNMDAHKWRDKQLVVYGKDSDFTIFCKCNTVSVEAVRTIKERAVTVLWYPDPCNSNWNAELREKVQECDLVFCALWNPAEKAKGWNKNSYFLHEGFDPLVDSPQREGPLDGQWPVTFIGNLDNHRQHILEGLQCYQPEAWGKDHARIVQESMINLNFVRNNDGCSDRVYKVLAAEGFLLTEDWPGRELDFVDGEDLVIFGNVKDLQKKIAYYLDNPRERWRIAKHGRETVQKFSRDNWAKTIIEKVKECRK